MVRRAESGIRERRRLSVPDRRLPRVSEGDASSGPIRRGPERRGIEQGAARIPRVLAVDDRPDDLAALEVMLRPLGAKVVKARCGEEALLHLLRERFAVILLAVHLPRLEGLQIAELIHQRGHTRDVPVIFISALCREAAWAFKGCGRGSCVDYLLQPIDPEVLRAKVRVFCDLWVRGEKIRRQAAQRELQDHFVASVAHAMRRELSAAKAQAQLALGETAGPDSQGAGTIRRFSAHVDRVAALVSDLLHVTRIGAGLLSLHRGEVDLAAVAREVANRMQPLAEHHRLCVRAPAPAVAFGDRDRIEQALTEVVATAVRCAFDGGPIEIGVQNLGDWLQVTVQGQAPGAVSDRQLERSTRAFAGDAGGIGLTTSRAIIERHGGRVWLEAGRVPGEGTTFFVQVPRARTAG